MKGYLVVDTAGKRLGVVNLDSDPFLGMKFDADTKKGRAELEIIDVTLRIESDPIAGQCETGRTLKTKILREWVPGSNTE